METDNPKKIRENNINETLKLKKINTNLFNSI